MAIPHVARGAQGLKASASTRVVRTRWNKMLSTLLILVVLGIVCGLVLGQLMVAGIENLLDLIALGQGE